MTTLTTYIIYLYSKYKKRKEGVKIPPIFFYYKYEKTKR